VPFRFIPIPSFFNEFDSHGLFCEIKRSPERCIQAHGVASITPIRPSSLSQPRTSCREYPGSVNPSDRETSAYSAREVASAQIPFSKRTFGAYYLLCLALPETHTKEGILYTPHFLPPESISRHGLYIINIAPTPPRFKDRAFLTQRKKHQIPVRSPKA
jgi:hypothetical protein